MTNRELLCDLGYEESIVFDNPEYDEAIIAVSMNNGAIIYSYTKMIELLCTRDRMTEEEAAEFIDYNICGFPAFFEDKPMPIVVYRLDDLM